MKFPWYSSFIKCRAHSCFLYHGRLGGPVVFSHIKLSLSLVYFSSWFMTTVVVPMSALLRFICLSPFSVFSALRSVDRKSFLGLVMSFSASDVFTFSKQLSRARDCYTGGFQCDLT